MEAKDNMLVPMVPQTDSKRSSRKGGGSRAASRSSSPVGSVGIPDGDETDESENMDLGELHTSKFLIFAGLLKRVPSYINL